MIGSADVRKLIDQEKFDAATMKDSFTRSRTQSEEGKQTVYSLYLLKRAAAKNTKKEKEKKIKLHFGFDYRPFTFGRQLLTLIRIKL